MTLGQQARTPGPGIMAEIVDWAGTEPNVLAVGLAGSHARGTATAASDIDLVLVVDDPRALLDDRGWLERFGEVERLADEDWGALQARRVHYRTGPEVEFGVVGRQWAAVPLDPGTARVLRDGFRVLHDPDGLLAAAVREVS